MQNGMILTNSERWPLMMDPQLQGVLWIKERESKNNLQVRRAVALRSGVCVTQHDVLAGCGATDRADVSSLCALQVVRMGADNMITIMEHAMEAGHSVLIENMGETIDAVLGPIITRFEAAA